MALNLDCIIDRNNIKPAYANIIGLSILPVIVSALTIVIWTLLIPCVKNMTLSKYRLFTWGTIINMLFVLHPTILKSSMTMLMCTPVDDVSYLDIDMEEECWTGDHWNHI